MKIMRFVYRGEMAYGVVSGENLRKIEEWPSGPYKIGGETIPMDRVKILAPLMPGKIVAVGLNYAKHVAEVSKEQTAPPAPLFFLKPPTAIIGPGEGIFYPEKCRELHYEGELAVIIKSGRERSGRKKWRIISWAIPVSTTSPPGIGKGPTGNGPGESLMTPFVRSAR